MGFNSSRKQKECTHGCIPNPNKIWIAENKGQQFRLTFVITCMLVTMAFILSPPIRERISLMYPENGDFNIDVAEAGLLLHRFYSDLKTMTADELKSSFSEQVDKLIQNRKSTLASQGDCLLLCLGSCVIIAWVVAKMSFLGSIECAHQVKITKYTYSEMLYHLFSHKKETVTMILIYFVHMSHFHFWINHLDEMEKEKKNEYGSISFCLCTVVFMLAIVNFVCIYKRNEQPDPPKTPELIGPYENFGLFDVKASRNEDALIGFLVWLTIISLVGFAHLQSVSVDSSGWLYGTQVCAIGLGISLWSFVLDVMKFKSVRDI